MPSIAQVQDGTNLYGGTAGGTGDAITFNLSPAIAAYATGQRFSFKASADNTTTTTVAINGLAAKTVKTRTGDNLSAGDIKSGQIAVIEYDGTNFQLVGGTTITGQLLNIQFITSSGTYTPTPGTTTAVVHLVGGGGGGGGQNTGSAQTSVGASGGSGAYAVQVIANPSSASITIGAAGTAGNGAAGGTGGSSVFNSVTCSGGVGGAWVANAGASSVRTGGSGGTVSGGSPSLSINGQKGGDAVALYPAATLLSYMCQAGGSSAFGQGGGGQMLLTGALAGVSATGYGAGGSGALNANAGVTAGLGGAGTAGAAIIYEYR